MNWLKLLTCGSRAALARTRSSRASRAAIFALWICEPYFLARSRASLKPMVSAFAAGVAGGCPKTSPHDTLTMRTSFQHISLGYPAEHENPLNVLQPLDNLHHRRVTA